MEELGYAQSHRDYLVCRIGTRKDDWTIVPIYGNGVTSVDRQNDSIRIKKGQGCRKLKHEGALFSSEGEAVKGIINFIGKGGPLQPWHAAHTLECIDSACQ